MSDALDEILADDWLGDVTSLDMADLRTRRATCKDVETGLSYLRRVVQGRLDIVSAEQRRRAEGGEEGDFSGLLARLPEVLADRTRGPGLGRLTTDFGTGAVDDDLVAELDAAAPAGDLSDVVDMATDQLAHSLDALQAFEAKVSGLRRQLFDRIDAIEGEIARRYQSGEASVDSLLS